MVSEPEINRALETFMADVEGHVLKGHPLPYRTTSMLGLARLDSLLRTVHHGGRMAVESVAEAVLWNKRKVVGPVAGAGTGVAVAASAAALGVTAMSGPQAGIVLGAGLTVGLAALAVQQAIRVKGYHDARKDVADRYQQGPVDNIDIDKLFNAVNLGGLSDLARSFEKARAAQREFELKANNIKQPPEVGSKGTCFQAAEYAYRLLYWYKRAHRLFDDGDRGDHRLRNVSLFVELVPRKLLWDAEKALVAYGQMTVDFLAQRTDPKADPRFLPLGPAPQNEGLLKWADWADACRYCPKGVEHKWRADVASVAGYGRAGGDPKRLVEYWDRVVKETNTRQLQYRDANERAKLASQLPTQGGPRPLQALKNQFLPPTVALTIAKPVTVLVIKELLNAGLLHAALSSGPAWGISAATGAVAAPITVVVPVFITMAAEALNSELNLRSIFDQNTDPAEKVRLIRDNLEAGGSAKVMDLRNCINASLESLESYWLKCVDNMWNNAWFNPLKSLVVELYRLHQYVVQLAVQSVLWELLLALIQAGRNDMMNALISAYGSFMASMKRRLKDDGRDHFHKNCKSACYRIDATTRSPEFRLLQA
jgi:hypothetical protein